jgi:hypothetical protein
MQLLGGQQRETPGKIKSHLVAEYTGRTGSGAITFLDTFVKNTI